MRILNFGSLNIDYVYAVDAFLRPGETKAAKSLMVNCGGKGLNQSIAARREWARRRLRQCPWARRAFARCGGDAAR